jgi:hypothetical protein
LTIDKCIIAELVGLGFHASIVSHTALTFDCIMSQNMIK